MESHGRLLRLLRRRRRRTQQIIPIFTRVKLISWKGFFCSSINHEKQLPQHSLKNDDDNQLEGARKPPAQHQNHSSIPVKEHHKSIPQLLAMFLNVFSFCCCRRQKSTLMICVCQYNSHLFCCRGSIYGSIFVSPSCHVIEVNPFILAAALWLLLATVAGRISRRKYFLQFACIFEGNESKPYIEFESSFLRTNETSGTIFFYYRQFLVECAWRENQICKTLS